MKCPHCGLDTKKQSPNFTKSRIMINMHNRGYTYQEIAKIFKITRERVRQRALWFVRMKKFIEIYDDVPEPNEDQKKILERTFDYRARQDG